MLQGVAGKWKLLEAPPMRNTLLNLPFHCRFQVIARGGKYGDLIQLKIKKLQFSSYNSTILCQHGFMQIIDGINESPVTGNGNQETAGFFCEDLVKSPLVRATDQYVYSETGSMLIGFRIFNLTQARAMQFEFQIFYRFLPREDAVGRYGTEEHPLNKNIMLVPGTYCDREYVNCSYGKCKIQSPGWPGVYARNVTCRYRLTTNSNSNIQIQVWQKEGDKIDVAGPRNEKGKLISDGLSYKCSPNQDQVKIYDGRTTRNQEIITFCGSGPLPKIVSTGPDILIELHSSELSMLRFNGFEIDAGLRAPSQTMGAIVENGSCDVILRSNTHRTGLLMSVDQWYPPGTECRYFFQGNPHEKIWIMFLDWSVNTERR